KIFINIDSAQKNSLIELCQALSKHELDLLDPSAHIAGFYQGQGSQRLDPDYGLYKYYTTVLSLQAGEDLEALPSYNELESTQAPPPVFSDDSPTCSGASRKRKHVSSNVGSNASNMLDPTFVEALCRKVVAEEHTRNLEKLHHEVSRMKDQICDQFLPDEFSKMETRIGDRLKKRLVEEIGQLRQELSEQRNCFEDQIHELDRQIDDRVWCEVDERVTGEKVNLEDYVEEQLREAMDNAQDNIKESIRKASFSVEFNDE
ncbi:hypothetical protein F5883DRAFT_678328, partial [Diaporthe sp. PMI_573]